MSPAPTQCVILVRPLDARAPGTWLYIGGRPFLDYLLLEARRFGFRKVLFITDGGASRLRSSLDSTQIGARTRLSIEVLDAEGAGSGGALHAARTRLDDRFLLLNGRCWFDFNWLSLITAPGAPDAMATLALREFERPAGRFPVVMDGPLVRSLGSTPRPGIGSAGVALLTSGILQHLSPSCSLENEVLPDLAARGLVHGLVASGRFIDMADPADRAIAGSAMPQWRRRPAVFLDRDGTLNQDTGYVHRIADFQWLPGAKDAIRRLNDAGRYVFLVTNQSGVGRDKFDEAAVAKLHDWINEDLRAVGAHIDDVRYCPHHPEATVPPYRMACTCRKPGPGMILDLLQEWQVVEEASILVGDSERDAAAARAAGIAGEIVPPGELMGFVDRFLAHG